MKSIFTFTAIWLFTLSASAQSPNLNVCVYDFCNAEGVENSTVHLKPGQGTEQWVFTQVNGCVTLQTSTIPAGTPMELSLKTELDPLSGINYFDVERIKKHLSGEQPFTETYQWLAGDVNKDHIVDSTDLVLLQNLIIGTYTELPDGNTRIFFPVDFVFAHPEMPLLDTLPEFPFTVINGQSTYAGFYAVILGDVARSGCVTSAVDEQSGNFIAEIFPNPVSDILQVRTPDNLTNKKITLNDALGKVMLTASGTEIPVAQLPNGMYFLKITSGDRQVFLSRIQVTHDR